jgi:hypothetical protein
MTTDATTTKSERVHFVCSSRFKNQLFDGAAQLDTTGTDLIKRAVHEYLNRHLDSKAKSQ